VDASRRMCVRRAPGEIAVQVRNREPLEEQRTLPDPWWRSATRNESERMERLEGEPGRRPGYPDGSPHRMSLEHGPTGVSLPLKYSDVPVGNVREGMIPEGSPAVDRPTGLGPGGATHRKAHEPIGVEPVLDELCSGLQPGSCRFGRKRNTVSIPPVRGFPQEPGGHTASLSQPVAQTG
jgi:hypothetical protein